MLYLGLRLDQPFHKPVNCFFRKQGGGSGPMLVTFQNDVHSHQGPYLAFDDTIRGFGIPYQEFKPAWQDFSFSADEDSSSLTCSGDGYTFYLKFRITSE